MEQISELRESLNRYFGWNKTRMTCFVKLLLALVLTRTVNLNKLACVFTSQVTPLASYRRIQRFCSQFQPITIVWLGLFFVFFLAGGQWHLTMDRTNWQWGKANINILTLAIAFKGTAILIYWILLGKKGNSDTPERIQLMQKFIKQFGKDSIASLLADREFVGKDWFQWLESEKTNFTIRDKNNTITSNAWGLPVDINALFYEPKLNEPGIIQGKRNLGGHRLYLAAYAYRVARCSLWLAMSRQKKLLKLMH